MKKIMIFLVFAFGLSGCNVQLGVYPLGYAWKVFPDYISNISGCSITVDYTRIGGSPETEAYFEIRQAATGEIIYSSQETELKKTFQGDFFAPGKYIFSLHLEEPGSTAFDVSDEITVLNKEGDELPLFETIYYPADLIETNVYTYGIGFVEVKNSLGVTQFRRKTGVFGRASPSSHQLRKSYSYEFDTFNKRATKESEDPWKYTYNVGSTKYVCTKNMYITGLLKRGIAYDNAETIQTLFLNDLIFIPGTEHEEWRADINEQTFFLPTSVGSPSNYRGYAAGALPINPGLVMEIKFWKQKNYKFIADEDIAYNFSALVIGK